MARLAGVIVGCAFAAVWGYHGLSSLPGVGRWAYLALVPSVIVGWRAYGLPHAQASVEWDKVKKRYFIIVALELLAMVILTNIVTAIGHAELIWPGLAVIVGLHFLPLALLFASPVYFLTAAVLTSLGLTTPFLPTGSAQLVLGLGAALTLWLTAVFAESGATSDRSC